MKRFLEKLSLVAALLCALHGAAAAQVQYVEYFFDTDPGPGLANGLPFYYVSPDTSVTLSAAIGGLSNGLHRLYVRSYDTGAKAWSLAAPKLFFKSPAASPAQPNVVAAEYFFDTDPGFGLATAFSVVPGQDISTGFSAGIASLSNGIHRLFVRTQDALGVWSRTSTQLFFKDALALPVAANITAAEYFFDADPGVGMGNAITLVPGQDISFTMSGGISALTNGLHRLYVRSRDANGRWSQVASHLFFKMPVGDPTPANVVAAEYFIDTDPGFGAATPVSVTAGQDLVLNFSAGIAALRTGLHRLVVRSRDAAGKWSLSANAFFYYEPAASPSLANIAAAEYFFDNDPGVGMGNAVTLTPGQDISFVFSGSIASLGNGLHRLVVRSRDANGKWSHSTTQLFFKMPVADPTPGNITAAEYFFDTDPGVGAGTAATVVPGQDISFSLNVAIGGLGDGIHRLYVRSRDANGKWSLAASQFFYKAPVADATPGNIVAAEYFFDTDPGVGAGKSITVSPGADIGIAFNPLIAQLSTSAFHRLFVRTKDANGKWSLAASQPFYIPPSPPPPPVRLTRIEYFIDTDPGFGSGIDVPFSRALDVTLSFTPSLSGLENGLHSLYVRSQDSLGRWSHSARQLFYREAAASRPLPVITAAEYFIDNDPGVGMATAVAVTPGQDITFAVNASLASLGDGLHRLYLRSRDADGSWSLSAPQLFFKEPAVLGTPANIVAAEYFIDTDPGFGAATPVSVTPGTDITIPMSAAITSLAPGAHRFVVRTQDADGKWSHSTPQFFFKEVVSAHTPGYLARLEWFWDTDPGFGSGNAVSIPANTLDLQNQNFTAPFPSSFAGSKHWLFVRAQDDWSLSTAVLVDLTGVALPVTLLRFRALREAERVRLEWAVEQERDMDAYVVERSADAHSFTDIGRLPATGAHDYALYDEQPLSGFNYYRLRQVDKSGKVEYSATVSVFFAKNRDLMQAYPNPASGYFNISTKMPLASVSLMDMNGRLVRRYEDVSGQYSLQGIAAGTYIVHALGEDGQELLQPLVVK